MEFNIAFSTIFYISIFIIPGLILRRFYFSGEFNKQFSQGNLFERLIWIIFCSIFSITVSATFFFAIRYFFNEKLLPGISYKTIKHVFDILGSNALPESKAFHEIYIDFTILALGIYFLSLLIGIFARNLILFFSAHNIFPVFKFNNYWYYFVRGKNAPKIEDALYWYTDADVLVTDGLINKMYSGKISDYFINPQTNQLESLFLEDTKRYKPRKKKSGYKLIPIPGNNFCIPAERILNVNLSYIYRKKGVSSTRKVLWTITQIFYIASSFLLIVFLFLDDFKGFSFDSIINKFFFCIISWFLLFTIRKVFKNLLLYPSLKEDSYVLILINIIIYLLQYLWIFNILNFFYSFLITTFSAMVLSILFIGTKKNTE